MKNKTDRVDPKSLVGRKLLVIDDVPFNRLLPGMVLRPFGVDVYEFSSVRDALAAMPEARFDVVLLDLAMPDTDGRKSLQILRSCEVFKNTKIYAYSAYANQEEHAELIQIGFSGILSKPIHNQELLSLFSIGSSEGEKFFAPN